MTLRTPKDILDAMGEPDIWGPWFPGDWTAWRTFLAAVFGLAAPADTGALLTACTGLAEAPTTRAAEVFAVCGRRAGKTRIMALIAAWLACFEDWRPQLSRGERAHILLLSKDREQARIAFNYIESFICEHPELKKLVKDSGDVVLELRNGVVIRVAAANFRGTRGFAAAAVIADELAFWFDGEQSANPSEEILRALRPAMLQFQGRGMLLCCSSPYKRSGPLWEGYRDNYGKPGAVLTWLAGTETMHPLTDVERAQIERDRERDAESAAAEYDCVWRDDVSGFLDAALVEAAMDRGITSRPPRMDFEYAMAVDPSGGRGDSFAAAIGHVEDGRVIVDHLYERKAPFQPSAVLQDLAALAARYRITRCRGDRYGEAWVMQGLAGVGLALEVNERNASDTYMSALPHFANEAVRLPDDRRAASQLTGLQRRTGAGGKDTVTHPRGMHDDVAVSICGLVSLLATDSKPAMTGLRTVYVDDRPVPTPEMVFFTYGVLTLVKGMAAFTVWGFTHCDPPARRRVWLLDAQLASYSDSMIDFAFTGVQNSLTGIRKGPWRGVFVTPNLASAVYMHGYNHAGEIPEPVLVDTKVQDDIAMEVRIHAGLGRIRFTEAAAECGRRIPLKAAWEWRPGEEWDALRLNLYAGANEFLGGIEPPEPVWGGARLGPA